MGAHDRDKAPLIDLNQMISGFFAKEFDQGDLHRTILDLFGDGVCICTPDCRCLYANAALETMTGYGFGELFGQDLSISIFAENESACLKSYMSEGPGPPDPATILRKDGSSFPAEITVQEIRFEDKILLAASFRDASSRTDLENELRAEKKAYQELVEGAEIVIMRLDMEGRILFANNYAHRLFEYHEGSMTGLNVMDTIVPRRDLDGNDLSGLLNLVIKDPKKFARHENENRTRSGAPLWISWTNKFIKSSSGRKQLLCVGHDLTERRRIEKERDQLFKAVENSPSSIVITDNEGYIEYVNPEFCQHTGYSLSEVMGENPRVLKSGKMDDAVYADMWKTISSGRIWRGDLLNKKKNGELYWESASIAPIKDDDGSITHYVAVKEDITDKKATQELKEDVERIMRHDLRTPLNALINLPPLILMDGNLSEQQMEFIRLIQDAGSRMLNQMNLYLDIFKIERGIYHYQPGLFDLGQILKRVGADLEELSRSRGLNLAITLDSRPWQDEPLPIMAEELMVYALLTNLVKNAMEASPRGKTVSADIRRENGIVMAVHNMGHVPRHIRDTFFEKYSSAGKAKGTGLGTYSARLMAETMGGTISFTTSRQRGTTVTVSLPDNT